MITLPKPISGSSLLSLKPLTGSSLPVPLTGSSLPKPVTGSSLLAPRPSPTVSTQPMVYAPTPPVAPKPTTPANTGGDPSVRAQQIALNAKGAGLKVDGLLGPLTLAAIKKYNTGDTIKTSTGAVVTPSTGEFTDTPVPPPVDTPATPNAYETAVSDAEKAYATAGNMSPDEIATQDAIDQLTSNTRIGESNMEGQGRGIPLDLVRGDQARLEKQSLLLAEPLNAKLARLQAQRTSAIEASKFALDRADKALATNKTDSKPSYMSVGEGNTVIDEKTGKPIYTAPKTYSPGSSGSGGSGLLSVAEAKSLGVPYGTTEAQAIAMKKTPGVGASSTSNDVVSVVDSLLNNPALSRISGSVDQLIGGAFGKAALAKNQFNQLKGMLSLENRQQLKGSGAISDFEFKVLSQAASALGRNLSDADFKAELIKLKTALQSEPATGTTNNGGGGAPANNPLGI